jgi:hypothetical protein
MPKFKKISGFGGQCPPYMTHNKNLAGHYWWAADIEQRLGRQPAQEKRQRDEPTSP